MVMTMPIISEFMLNRRIETLMIALILGKKEKFENVVNNTILTIENRAVTEVHESNLGAYIKNIEMALMLFQLGQEETAKEYLTLALEVIYRDLGPMTPAYVFANRLQNVKNHDNSFTTYTNIGSLYKLPDDILGTIADIVNAN
jgi:hypothetical protein